VSYSRGIPAGEYIVNVHMYGPLPPGTAVPVSVAVSVKKKFDDARLVRHNQEETAFRFRLTADGDFQSPQPGNLIRPLTHCGKSHHRSKL